MAVGSDLLPLAGCLVLDRGSPGDLSRKVSTVQQIVYLPGSIFCYTDAGPQSRLMQ